MLKSFVKHPCLFCEYFESFLLSGVYYYNWTLLMFIPNNLIESKILAKKSVDRRTSWLKNLRQWFGKINQKLFRFVMNEVIMIEMLPKWYSTTVSSHGTRRSRRNYFFPQKNKLKKKTLKIHNGKCYVENERIKYFRTLENIENVFFWEKKNNIFGRIIL